jgi:hypothetical protein
VCSANKSEIGELVATTAARAHTRPRSVDTVTPPSSKSQDYAAELKAGVDRGYLTVHASGAHLSFTQAGADLFV